MMMRGASGVEMVYFDAGLEWCGEDRSRAGPERRPTRASLEGL